MVGVDINEKFRFGRSTAATVKLITSAVSGVTRDAKLGRA
jgi:hypothetical protein